MADSESSSCPFKQVWLYVLKHKYEVPIRAEFYAKSKYRAALRSIIHYSSSIISVERDIYLR